MDDAPQERQHERPGPLGLVDHRPVPGAFNHVDLRGKESLLLLRVAHGNVRIAIPPHHQRGQRVPREPLTEHDLPHALKPPCVVPR